MPEPVQDALNAALSDATGADGTPLVQPGTEDKKVPDVVSRAEYDELVGHTKKLTTSLIEAGKKLEVIDKVAAMLQGKEESTLTKEEQLVVSELKRLMPHIIPNLKALDTLPDMKKVVDGAAQATSDTLVQAAFAYQLELQQEAGIPVADDKTNFYIGTAIKEWINQDQTRRARFWRGDRTVVQEGFAEVKKSVIDPFRTGVKTSAAEIVKHRPKSAAPAGSAGVGEGPQGLDYSNPKAVREALKAALA